MRAGQYWRLEKLKSFDDFLDPAVPGIETKSLLPDVDSREIFRRRRGKT